MPKEVITMASRVSHRGLGASERILTSLLGSHNLRKGLCGSVVIVYGGLGQGVNIGKLADHDGIVNDTSDGLGPTDNVTQWIMDTMPRGDPPQVIGDPIDPNVSNDTQPGSWYA
jgi:hypothetical protein